MLQAQEGDTNWGPGSIRKRWIPVVVQICIVEVVTVLRQMSGCLFQCQIFTVLMFLFMLTRKIEWKKHAW